MNLTTPSLSSNKIECKQSGTFRHPNDCKKFYRCVEIEDEKYLTFEYTCPTGTVFDKESKICLWPFSVSDCKNYYAFV